MADTSKKGLTGFGWLLLAGAGAYFLGSKERRDKTLAKVTAWTKKTPVDPAS